MDWKLLAAIPPLLLWCGLFAYLAIVDARVKKAEEKLNS